MVQVKVKFLKDVGEDKKDKIVNMSKKDAEFYRQEGFVEILDEVKPTKTKKKKTTKTKTKKKKTTKPKTKKAEKLSKQILDEWANQVLLIEDLYTTPEGVTIPNTKAPKNYTPELYGDDIILWIAPLDSLVVEFEDAEKAPKWISYMESAAKALKFDYCVTGHGGKSDYFRIFNIQGLPVNEDNKKAKLLLLDMLLPPGAKDQLDRTNLGWTFSPVIGHKHWKKKYNGAIHKILRGKNPLEHNNECPKDVLKQLKVSKSQNTKKLRKIGFDDSWVSDFLLNYCCNNELPGGSRHHIIEKNLAAYTIHHPDRNGIKKRYFRAQKRKNDTMKTWETAILKGDYKDVSAGELVNYIKEHNLNYEIPKKYGKTQTQNIEETTEIKRILNDSNLFSNIVESELDKKIVGELPARKAIFLTSCMRLVKNINPVSSNLMVNDDSGKGKDHITKNTLSIWGNALVIKRTRISPAVFTYWKPVECWDGFVCYLEDISNNILNHDVFKVMASGGSHATVLINQVATDLEIKGKPVIIVTVAAAAPNNENLRRFPIQNLDSNKDQTKEIVKRKLLYAAQGISLEYNPDITAALNLLKRVNVKIPFANVLINEIPINHTIMRTNIDRLIDMIKASAALHQYQREVKDGYVLANSDDYDIAVDILNSQLSNPYSIPLTKDQKKILSILNNNDYLDFEEIQEKVSSIGERWLRVLLQQLVANELLELHYTVKEGVKKKVQQWKKVNFTVEPLKYSKDIPGLNALNALNALNFRGSNQKNSIIFNENNNNSNKNKEKDCRNNAINTDNTFNTNNTNNAFNNISYNDFRESLPKHLTAPLTPDALYRSYEDKLNSDTYDSYIQKALHDGDIYEQGICLMITK